MGRTRKAVGLENEIVQAIQRSAGVQSVGIRQHDAGGAATAIRLVAVCGASVQRRA